MGAAELDNLVQPGQVLAGKYRIDRVLGKGGMGVVVSAHHIALDEKVAIKFLLPAAVGKPELMARFEREARAAVKIKSEHIARVLDVGVLDTGAPYMVMEFLEGQDLSQIIARRGPLPYQQVADFILQACEAIVEAHALGIVHRDLKPANLFVVRGADGLDAVKVLDFGISKAAGVGHDMTQTQSMLGSPYYMSPEQMQSARSVDARTDIWSLGCILHEAVTGRVPFEADSLPELVVQILNHTPRSVRAQRPEIDAGYDQVVTRCLEKDRTRRYAHIGELASALVPFAPVQSRASAERVQRVVQTSGLAAAGASGTSPVAGPHFGTMPMKPVSLSSPNPAAQSGTNTGGHTAYVSPAIATSAMPSSPPLGTPPPGSAPKLAGTTDAASWGQTSSPASAAIPKTSGIAIVGAALGGLLVLGTLLGGVLYASGVIKLSTGGVDAASSAAVTATPVTSVSSTPSAAPSLVPSAEPALAKVTEAKDAAAPIATQPPDAGSSLVLRPMPPAPLPQPQPQPQPQVQPAPSPAPNPAPGPAPGGRPADCERFPKRRDANGNDVFRKECL